MKKMIPFPKNSDFMDLRLAIDADEDFLAELAKIGKNKGEETSRESEIIGKEHEESPVEIAARKLGDEFRAANTPKEKARVILDQIFDDVYIPQPQLPTAAPELYADRNDKSEKPPAFIKRVYAPWLGKGLNRTHILHLDKQLYMGLHQWSRKNGVPDDLRLPTKSELVTQELEAAGPDGVRQASRIANAAYMRAARKTI